MTYEQEKNLQCASVNFTIEKILKGINVQSEERVASYGDLIKRHLREEATIILVRDQVDKTLGS